MIPFQPLPKAILKPGAQYIYYLILFLAIFFCPLNMLARGFNFKAGKEMAVIPFAYKDGLIILPFIIENRAVNLILDTGVRNIVLFKGNKTYGLQSEFERKVSFSGIGMGNSIKGTLVPELKAESGNIEGSGLAIMFIAQKNFSQNISYKIDGLIGYEIFSRFLVTIDYSRSELVLTNPKDFFPADVYIEKDLSLVDTKPFLNFEFSFSGREKKDNLFFIDSGAGFELLLNKNPYPDDKKNKNRILGMGLTGIVKGKSYHLNHIYLDGYNFRNISLSIPTSGIYLNEELMDDREGVLGGKFLQKFEKVIFDYSNKKIYFKQKSSIIESIAKN